MASNYGDDKRIFELISKIVGINSQICGKEGGHSALMTVDKKKEIKAEGDKLADELYNLLIEVDRIRIRKSPLGKQYANLYRKMLKIFDLHNMWDSYYEQILDFHENTELLDRGAFINNYYKLAPPYIQSGVTIPEGVKAMCHESRWAYVYGQYSASVALSRAVIEAVLKQKFNLQGNLEEIISQAKAKGFISGLSAWNADGVRKRANRVLHEALPSKENDAKSALDHVLHFIEEIYLEKS